ncbi:MAG: tetratricopeptide repeat protein [Gemmatimonadales bacterium]
MLRLAGTVLLLLLRFGSSADGQSRSELLEGAERARLTAPDSALALAERALALDTLDYEANWRAAVLAVELGQDPPEQKRTARQDSLYRLAERYARRAVTIDSNEVHGLFALSMALGRAALTRGPRQRIAMAGEVYRAASRARALAPDHDGVLHVLGLWHAEVMRTSGFNRFMARNILGGKLLGQASWDSAVALLSQAVERDPDRIYHRLDLARALADRKMYEEARHQLDTLLALPARYRLDPRYRREAAALLETVERRSGGGRA